MAVGWLSLAMQLCYAVYKHLSCLITTCNVLTTDIIIWTPQSTYIGCYLNVCYASHCFGLSHSLSATCFHAERWNNVVISSDWCSILSGKQLAYTILLLWPSENDRCDWPAMSFYSITQSGGVLLPNTLHLNVFVSGQIFSQTADSCGTLKTESPHGPWVTFRLNCSDVKEVDN